MAAPFFGPIKGTTSGTPGTGAFTPNAASSGYLAWSTVPVGVYLVRFEDGTAWELRYSYWNGTTLSRTTNAFVSSSTGSGLTLTSAAVATFIVDPSEIQPHLGGPHWAGTAPQTATNATSTWGWAAITSTGTSAAAALATTNYLTEQSRVQYSSATTANAQAGWSHTNAQIVVSTSAGRGGGEFVARFGASALPTGPRLFVGLTTTTFVANTGEPSALTANIAAFTKDSTDTNIQFLTNSNVGGGTKIDTGIPLTANGWYEASVWFDPGSNTAHGLLIRLDTGDVWYGSTSTDVPANGSLMLLNAIGGLSATTGTAIVMHMGGMYVRTGT